MEIGVVIGSSQTAVERQCFIILVRLKSNWSRCPRTESKPTKVNMQTSNRQIGAPVVSRKLRDVTNF